MKKRNVLLLASMMVSTMLMFAGCGADKDAPTEDPGTGASVTSEEGLFSDVASEDVTLESYINSDSDLREQIDAMADGSGMEIDIEGNTLTYTYAFDEVYDDATIKAMATEAESAMESMASSFESVASTLEAEAGIDDVTVEVIYVDGAGTEIYKASY